MAKIGLVVLILGLVGALLGGGTLLVSLLLPALTDGRTSWDEALFGIIPGALVLAFSFVVAVVGLFVMLKGRKSATAVRQ
jgi:Na+-transporting NADH:ubiquinone oxidoreductase subunit NqrD